MRSPAAYSSARIACASSKSSAFFVSGRAPRERERAQLLGSDRLRELRLQLLQHSQGFVIASEFRQSLRRFASEGGGNPPWQAVLLKKIDQSLFPADVDCSPDLIRRLLRGLVLLGGKTRRLLAQRHVCDGVQQPQKLASVGSVGIVGKIEEDAIFRKQRERGTVEPERHESNPFRSAASRSSV